jgi:outer membrane protein assembly factor BamD (BamD/ComL family)
LEAEGSQKLPQAIETLEQLLKSQPGGIVSAEAAIELGRLYVKAKRFEDAQKTLEFAVAALAKDNLTKLELTEAQAAPFTAAAKKALGNIKYDKEAGRKEFEEAEKLRKADKFAEAVKAYQAILKDFPATDYATRSDLSLGYCMAATGQPNMAATHWKKFITAAPAGAWRGQAYVALTDLLLDELLDLPEAGKYAELAKTSLPTGLADEKIAESWQEVAYDIHLRVGTVALIQGKSDVAAEAFGQAKKAMPPKSLARAVEALDALIDAAKAKKAVIPADVDANSGDKRVATALAVGTIYRVARRYDAAETFFDRVTGKPAVPAKQPGDLAIPAAAPMSGATPAQQAFATFSKAATLLTRAPEGDAKAHAQVKEMLLASVKTFPAGTWHDETLYCLATITQDDAENAFGQKAVDRAKSEAGKKAKDTAGRAALPKTPTTQEADKQAKAEKDRLASLKKALGEAVPFWTELGKRYPDSPRCEQAFYSLGVIYCECEQWKEAGSAFDTFLKGYPHSPWAGDVYVRVIDVALEEEFDLAGAKGYADKAGGWAKAHSGSPVSDDGANPGPADGLRTWSFATACPTSAALQRTVYECFLRAALVAYLNHQADAAAALAQAAGPEQVPDDPTEHVDLTKVGVNTLIRIIRSGKAVTESRAMADAKTDKERLAMQLGDLYLATIRPDRAEVVFRRLAATSGNTSAEGYALLQLAVALDRQMEKRADALDVLRTLSSSKYANTYWGPYGMFRLALFTYNQHQDPNEVMPLYKDMFIRYPHHPMAYSAMLCYALNAIRSGNKQEAVRSVGEFLDKYKDSPHAQYLQTKLRELQDKGDKL